MTKKSVFFILVLITFVFTCIGAINPVSAQEAKTISVDQICESHMDEPMGGNNLYKDKAVKTSIKPNMVRKIPSLCSDAPKGTFTVEFVTKRDSVVQCFCNASGQKSILQTPKGTTVNIEGTFKSMTASFFESESKQCTITIEDCTFN